MNWRRLLNLYYIFEPNTLSSNNKIGYKVLWKSEGTWFGAANGILQTPKSSTGLSKLDLTLHLN